LKSKFTTFIDYLIFCIHIYIYISTVEEHLQLLILNIIYYLIITSTIWSDCMRHLLHQQQGVTFLFGNMHDSSCSRFTRFILKNCRYTQSRGAGAISLLYGSFYWIKVNGIIISRSKQVGNIRQWDLAGGFLGTHISDLDHHSTDTRT
jgi:hypothetical protein